ncbi:hypothetical protein BK718_33025 [Bacillus thuringiensis serovar andalousiensis]|uniref:hypothetical protein n=1 Tax=Bacillus cereus group TaxID=86661 RepID=UPI0006AC4AAF|nr:hypothetical protein [Bacillus thuringiensis]OTX19062.1 hypothetical protein BK718_33025 [Bacillus thuringiensis serovar andalousiensis]
MKFFKKINNDNFYELVEDVPELSKVLDIHTEEELFELGYCVLEDSILAIRSLDLDSSFNKSIRSELCFWVQNISSVIHNIPGKLRLRDTTFLKEELYKAIKALYILKQRRFEGIIISTTLIEECIKNVSDSISK